MRLICLFDVPSTTDKEVKEYRKFREFLLKKGFVMMQWSMYYKHMLKHENIEALSQSIRSHLPQGGNLMLIEMTDKQFESIQVYNNFERVEPPRKYDVLELF